MLMEGGSAGPIAYGVIGCSPALIHNDITSHSSWLWSHPEHYSLSVLGLMFRGKKDNSNQSDAIKLFHGKSPVPWELGILSFLSSSCRASWGHRVLLRAAGPGELPTVAAGASRAQSLEGC